jgi:hypothetical protein
MNVVTAYLYESQDLDIYMKVSDGISVPNANVESNMFCVKFNKLLYGLKQSRRMWYNRLEEFVLKKATLIMMIILVSSFANPQLDFTLFQYMLMI